MDIKFTKRFRKQLKKAPVKVQQALEERLDIFLDDTSHPLLNNHALHGEYSGLRSINITGDWRALFKEVDGGEIYFFVLFGTHSNLYK